MASGGWIGSVRQFFSMGNRKLHGCAEHRADDDDDDEIGGMKATQLEAIDNENRHAMEKRGVMRG